MSPAPPALPRPGRVSVHLPASASADGGAGPLRVAVTLSHAVVAVVVVLAAAALLLGGLGSEVSVPIAVGGLLLGLPHGAVDHWAPRLRGRSPSRRTLGLLLLLYVALAVLSWLALRSVPALGLAAFLVISLAHFGAGEATFYRLLGIVVGRSVGLAVGLVVVVLPLVAHPASVAPYLALLVPGWDGRLPLWVRAVSLVLVTMVLAVALTTSWRRGQLLVVRELALLAALVLLAPPVVGVAVYFGAWHAVRHSAVLVSEESAIARIPGPVALRRLARRAVLPTVAAVGALALVWWVLADGRLENFLGQQIWVLAALTVPHGVVVWWLDRTRVAAPA